MAQQHPSGHGLDDEAIKEGHDFIQKADQDQRVEQKSGLPDSAVEAEQEFEAMVDGSSASGTKEESSKPIGETVKETLGNLLPDNLMGKK